jgi:hypothetical protein
MSEMKQLMESLDAIEEDDALASTHMQRISSQNPNVQIEKLIRELNNVINVLQRQQRTGFSQAPKFESTATIRDSISGVMNAISFIKNVKE